MLNVNHQSLADEVEPLEFAQPRDRARVAVANRLLKKRGLDLQPEGGKRVWHGFYLKE
jgi:hypothetical protein